MRCARNSFFYVRQINSFGESDETLEMGRSRLTNLLPKDDINTLIVLYELGQPAIIIIGVVV